MNLLDILYCYPERRFLCTDSQFQAALDLFEKRAETLGQVWNEEPETRNRIFFTKGDKVAFTLDYQSERLAIEVVYEYFPVQRQLRVAVGNWGFPFEPLLSKPRYLRLLSELCRDLESSDIGVTRCHS